MSQPNPEHLTDQNDAPSTLRALLVRLGADPANLQADRQDAAEGQANLLQRILVEIEETILPRQLKVYFGQTKVATLRVCHRRLLSLDLVSETGPSEQTAQHSAPQIYAQRLRHLVATTQDTGFRITRQVCDTGVETESCSVAQLVDSLELQHQDSRLNGFLSMIRADVDAWVLQVEDASQHSSHGPAVLTRQLTELAGLDQISKQKRGQALKLPEKTPSYLVLSMSRETNVFIAWDQVETLLVAVPAQHLTTVSTVWHSVFSTQ